MNLSINSRALLLTLAAGLTAVTMPLAQAQSSGTMHVPFPFQCGGSRLAPGTYTISSSGGHVTTIRGDKVTTLAMSMSFENDRREEKGRALFVRAGDRYYLKDVWVPGSTSHLHFFLPKAKALPVVASNDTRPATIELAMLDLPR